MPSTTSEPSPAESSTPQPTSSETSPSPSSEPTPQPTVTVTQTVQAEPVAVESMKLDDSQYGGLAVLGVLVVMLLVTLVFSQLRKP